MAQLAILGHKTRSEEVIEILEMLGGRNVRNYACNLTDYAYSINDQGIIDLYISPSNSSITFTLEEFLEKFPYKVGDKVYNVVQNENQTITNLIWDPQENEIVYQTNYNEYVYVNYLQPYKEETKEDKGTLVQIDLTRELCVADEVEVILGDYEFVLKDGKTYFIKKKPKYPKTYEECCDIIEYPHNVVGGHKAELLSSFQNLLICRDVYWEIAGEQMGLGEPWEPQFENCSIIHYCIFISHAGEIYDVYFYGSRCLLAFPTAEMRNAFLDNFKELIEECKELL